MRVPCYPIRAPQARKATPPALQRRVLAELRGFTDWLDEHGEPGYVGETGWPDDHRGDAAEWNALADRWYEHADTTDLWVTYWATGEWWGTTYPLAAYEDRSAPVGVDSANTQAPVVEAHPSSGGYRRGITDAGGEFGYAPTTQPTSPFSNRNPGRYNIAYHYDRRATFDYLAGRGIDLVKIPFRWERIQRRPGAALWQDEVRRLRAAVKRADAAGLAAIIDMHNFGAYYLASGGHGVRRAVGTRALPIADFVDVWRRLSARFEGQVLAYNIMTEPVKLPARGSRLPAEVWERASQRALSAIRARGDETLVMVPGYRWSGAQVWPRVHPDPWIHDPADAYFYEAHHYWDRDHSGTYQLTYAQEVAAAEADGW
jgi:hypothetical protein